MQGVRTGNNAGYSTLHIVISDGHAHLPGVLPHAKLYLSRVTAEMALLGKLQVLGQVAVDLGVIHVGDKRQICQACHPRCTQVHTQLGSQIVQLSGLVLDVLLVGRRVGLLQFQNLACAVAVVLPPIGVLHSSLEFICGPGSRNSLTEDVGQFRV